MILVDRRGPEMAVYSLIGPLLLLFLFLTEWKALAEDKSTANRNLGIIGITTRNFIRYRNQLTNVADFRTTFLCYLQEISESKGSNGLWIDAGAGFNFAQIEYRLGYILDFEFNEMFNPRERGFLKSLVVTNRKLPGVSEGAKLKTYAFALEFPTDVDRVQALLAKGDLEIMHRIEERDVFADQPLPKADLITDIFGPISYVKNPFAAINLYLDRLVVGGRLYFMLVESYFGPSTGRNPGSSVLGEENRHVAFWLLDHLQGAKIEMFQRRNYFDVMLPVSFSIEKVEERKTYIPEPELEAFFSHEGSVPTRWFRRP